MTKSRSPNPQSGRRHGPSQWAPAATRRFLGTLQTGRRTSRARVAVVFPCASAWGARNTTRSLCVNVGNGAKRSRLTESASARTADSGSSGALRPAPQACDVRAPRLPAGRWNRNACAALDDSAAHGAQRQAHRNRRCLHGEVGYRYPQRAPSVANARIETVGATRRRRFGGILDLPRRNPTRGSLSAGAADCPGRAG